MLYELSERSKTILKSSKGLQMCRKCCFLKHPFGLYVPEYGVGTKTKQNLYTCEECTPKGLEIKDVIPRASGCAKSINITAAEAIKDIFEGTKSPITTEYLRSIGFTKSEVNMSVYRLSTKGYIKKIRHGCYTSGDGSEVGIPKRSIVSECTAVLWAIKSHPGSTLVYLGGITSLSAKTVGRRTRALIAKNEVWRDRDGSTKPYLYYPADHERRSA